MKTGPVHRSRTVAYDVLAAFGGEARLRGVAGAWKLAPFDSGLLFRLPAGAWCAVTRTAPDLYRIEVGHRDHGDAEGITDDVPAAKLADTFTAMTGIRLTI